MAACSLPVSAVLVVILAIWPSFCSQGVAATWYFSPDGHDNADGQSPDHAKKSLTQISESKLKGGDEVLLHRGGVWRETLTIPADGAPGRPIVVGAYGDGDRPCIDGGDPIDPSRFKVADSTGVFVLGFDHKVSSVFDSAGEEMKAATSLVEVSQTEGSAWCDGTRLFIHPTKNQDPRSGKARYEIPVREVCVEISKSHLALRSIAVCHAARADRGAVTVWADHDLAEIELRDCEISNNCGRGVWFCGPASSAIHDVLITQNQFRSNDGSGASLTLTDGGQIRGNTFTHNCRLPLEAWQAGVRVWSTGIRNLAITDNSITDERWMHDRDSAMGIHCDETGDHVTIAGNKISNVDHAGIAIENTRGVTLEKNIITDCNIGIFINRAGHDHIIRDNTVKDSRSQGLAIQGWLAHGVDAQPEITVQGRLLTRNVFENNVSIGSHFGNLKATNGGEKIDSPLGNIFRNNDLGPERAGFIEWGDRSLDRYDQWPVPGGRR